jgi:glycosyltransferase involved in cell wall biosynthesis
MNILHLHFSSEFAGSERYAATLAAEQARQGHEVRIIIKSKQHLKRWREESSPAAVWLLPKWAIGPLRTWAIYNYNKGLKAEILHTHLGGAHRAGQGLTRVLQAPHVATMHLRYKEKEHKKCAGLIAIAHWQTKEIPQSFNGLSEVIWNWVPPLPKSSPNGIEKIRKTYNISDNCYTFLSVGRLHPQKEMLRLITAFQNAFQNKPLMRLLIVGDGPQRAAIESAIKSDNRIYLLGYQTQVQDIYATANAYVSASRHEPFGLTILEAMQAQLPIVCTRTEGPTEFFKSQKNQPFWSRMSETESLSKALQDCFQTNKKPIMWDMSPFSLPQATNRIMTLYGKISQKNNA